MRFLFSLLNFIGMTKFIAANKWLNMKTKRVTKLNTIPICILYIGYQYYHKSIRTRRTVITRITYVLIIVYYILVRFIIDSSNKKNIPTIEIGFKRFTIQC